MMAKKEVFNPNQARLFSSDDAQGERAGLIAPARPERATALFTVRLFAQGSERPAYRKSWSCKVLRSSEQYALEQARDYVRRMGKLAGLRNTETTFLVERNGALHEYFEFDGTDFRRVEEGSFDEQEQ